MGERPGSTSRGRLVVAGIVGNVMEWYDFAVFGYFAVTLGHLFFPSDSPTASLLASFGVFAVGFLMRPLGGIAFGWVGDRLGRAPALLYSVMAMALPTFAIGLLPTYASAGMAAPALMVACRVLQGLAVGGEYGNSVVFLVETAPAGRHARGGPLADLLRGQKLALLRGVGICMVNAVGFYMIFIYFVTWLRVAVHLPLAHALYVNTAT